MKMKPVASKGVRSLADPAAIAFLALFLTAPPRVEGQLGDEITVEGTLTLAPCPFSFPVCVLEGDPGYGDYRILQDAACQEWLGRHVRVQGTLSQGDCDPTNPGPMRASPPANIEELSVHPICGDADHDQSVDLSDVVLIFDPLFSESPAQPVPSVSDVNGDGELDISDGIYLL